MKIQSAMLYVPKTPRWWRRPYCWFNNHVGSITAVRETPPGFQRTCDRCGLKRWTWKI